MRKLTFLKTIPLLSLSFALFTATQPLSSAAINWTGATSDLSLNTNWTPNSVPGPGDTATFTGGGLSSPSLTSASASQVINPGNFSFSSTSYVFNITGAGSIINFQNNSGIVNTSGVTQYFNVNTGGTLSFALSNTPNNTSSNPVIFTLNDGSFVCNGTYSDPNALTVNMTNGSLISTQNGGTLSFKSINADNTSAISLNNGSLILSGTSNIAAPISGNGGTFDMAASGQVATLSNPGNTYTGQTTVQTGTISVTNIGAIQNSSNISILAPGTFDFATSGTYNGPVSDTGSLTVEAGAGNTLQLAGLASYTGSTTVNSGTLEFDNLGTFTSTISLPTITSFVDFNQVPITTATIAGAITGIGGVIINGNGATGTVTLTNGGNTYSGGTTVSGGTLLVSNMSVIPSSGGILTNGTVDFETSGTYAGAISGTGGVIVNPGIGNTTVFSGPVSYSGSTLLNSGTLEFDNISTLAGQVTLASGTLVDFNQIPATPATISGQITGAGGVLINGNGGTGTVIFTGTTNNYTGNTQVLNGIFQTSPGTQPGNIAVTSPGVVDFEQGGGTAGVFAGILSGTGSVTINNAGGSGTVVLGNSSNSYSGTTTVSNGTLEVFDLVGYGTGNIIVNSPGTLRFEQTVAGTFTNNLSGNGTVIKAGKGKLTYGIDELGFTGLTDIINGELHIDHDLGGRALVRGIGLLKGKGKIVGDVEVKEFGGISPGNNDDDTLRIGGNFKQRGESTHYAHATIFPNLTAQSSLIHVTGEAEIRRGPFDDLALNVAKRGISDTAAISNVNFGTSVVVDISGASGQLPVGTTVSTPILHADGGVKGQYGYAVGNYPLLTPYLTYGDNDVYLNFINTLAVLPVTYNERQVATRLEGISNPTPEEEAILIGITSLPTGEAQHVLDQLTGEQYTSTLLAAELANRGFMRRLFDPLRLVINEPYEDRCQCECPLEVDTWCDASGHQAFLQTGQNFHRVEISGYEFSIGAQMSLYDHFTLGAAYSYGKDFTDYHVGGHAKTMVNLGGVYTLFRPSCYYVLGEFVFGCSHNKITRHIDIGDQEFRPRSNVKVWQAGYYVEAGKDFLWRYVLAQPFVGLEGGHYRFDSFEESNGGLLGLAVDKKTVTPAYTRFGVHLTTRDRPKWWSFGVDLAWLYRLTSTGTSVDERFLDFGTPFDIKGAHLQRNSVEAAANFSVQFCGRWEIFGEVTTQTWTNAATYSFLGGLSASW